MTIKAHAKPHPSLLTSDATRLDPNMIAGPDPDPGSLDLGELRALSVLGRGAKGVVFHARHGDRSLALKVIPRPLHEDGYRRVLFERDVLLALRHPLLPSLRGVVSTDEILAFAIDRCPGGDLKSLLKRQTEKTFSVDIIRFYAAEIVLALEHLHGMGIVYRDLKPENILIQADGHLMLVDFDLSTRLPTSPTRQQPPPPTPPPPPRRVRSRCFSRRRSPQPPPSSFSSSSSKSSSPSKSNSFVGTEEYVAPEVIEGKGHDHAVDWWGLGVVMYEMLYGRTPFRGKERRETFFRILSMAPDMTGERTPLRDLIARLLEKDPQRRINCEGVKSHAFFRGVDWGSVTQLARPPFIPGDGDQEEGEGEGIDVEAFVREMLEGIAARRKEKKEGRWVGEVTDAPPPSNKAADFGVF